MVEKKSFVNAISKWYYEVQDNCPRAEVIFVGTKCDLVCDFIAAKKTSTLLDKDKVIFIFKIDIKESGINGSQAGDLQRINSTGIESFI